MKIQYADPQVVWRSRSGVVSLRFAMKAITIAVVLAGLLLVTCGLSLALGSYPIGIIEVIQTLRGEGISKSFDDVIFQFRFPRTLVSMLAGAMMAISGTALQTVTRNGLADPSLVGVSQGAALVVVGAIVAFPDLPTALRPWLAFMGALGVASVVHSLTFAAQAYNAVRFILIGIGVSALLSSMISVLMTYGDIDRAVAALSWLAGSVHAADWTDVRILGLWGLLLLLPTLALSRIIGVLRMGDQMARALGVQDRRARGALIALAVGFAAATTAIIGPLSFVGLIAPHFARWLARCGSGMHMILTALCGALLVVTADLLGRTLFAPVQIPAGLVTAIIGVPMFIRLLHGAGAKSYL